MMICTEECVFLDIDQLKHDFDEEDKRNEQFGDLLIDKMVVKCQSESDSDDSDCDCMVSFSDNKLITYFGINSDGSYNTQPILPKLVNHKTKNISINMVEGYAEAVNSGKLIGDNWGQYRKLKSIYFLKCLQDKQVIEQTKPDFVTFNGLFAGIMRCIEEPDKYWRVNAQKFNGVIYIFSLNYDTNKLNEKGFCGLKFAYLMTDRDQQTLNEYEKFFSINSMKFGSHKIVSVNEIDAIGSYYGLPIELRVKQMINSSESKRLFKQRNLLKTWSQCLVSGIDHIVYGFRDSANYLRRIEEFHTPNIPDRCDDHWSDVKCFQFLDRLLQFINRCVTQEYVVYDFWYFKGAEFVECTRLNPHNYNLNSFLPKWYVVVDDDDDHPTKKPKYESYQKTV